MRPFSMISAALLIASVGGEAAAQAATQFDLVCIGTRQMELDGPKEPLNYRLRIDIAAKRWCWNECERTFEIAEVAPERLTLQFEEIETARRNSRTENTVSRITGEHVSSWIQSRPIPTFIETRGRCEPAPFSGFPTARF